MKISEHIKKIKLLFFLSLIVLFVCILLAYFSFINLSFLLFSSGSILVLSGILMSIVMFQHNELISQLQDSERQATMNTKRLEESQTSKDQSIQELSALNYAIDQTILYARITKSGAVISLGERFTKLLKINLDYQNKNLSDLMNLGEVQKNRLSMLIAQNKGGVFNEEFEFKSISGKKIWLDVSILTVFKSTGTLERLVLCTDISKRKEAQNEIERLNADAYKEKEEIQKSNASQIVEAQEEERKRIAKEIHDNIGQMLTALKFNIESINTNNIEKTNQKIEGLKQLSKDLILGIRTATFNLTPPELKDYGISIALQKMAKELSKLTGKNIVFENTSNSELRFNSLVETNLYRVTQEALNNAIKYAKSDYILISINSSESILSIIIDDNGQGFDLSKIPNKPKNNAEGGMGLFFMKERMNYIDGRIFISSTPGKGTRISLNYNFN